MKKYDLETLKEVYDKIIDLIYIYYGEIENDDDEIWENEKVKDLIIDMAIKVREYKEMDVEDLCKHQNKD